MPVEIRVTTSVARRGPVSTRLTRIGLTVGQELGATDGGGGVPPGVAAGVLPGVTVPFGVAVPGVLPGLTEPSTEGEALPAGLVVPESVALVWMLGVREPPPAQPARTRVPASRNGARRRRAGFIIEA